MMASYFDTHEAQKGIAFGTGIPRSQEDALPEDPTAGLCLGTYGGPEGRGCF